jgi:ubiquinone/menaquinone biosynthesis C-methylase UbiE
LTGTKHGEFDNTRYGRIAGVYDLLVRCSGPGIDRSRRYFLGRLPFQPQNPLIVGCGSGKFAVDFVRAENPPRLAINDLASHMLSRTLGAVRETGWRGELVALHGDAAGMEPCGEFDLVVLQYVLTCFPQHRRIAFLHCVKKLVAPGGLLLISDYSRPGAGWMRPAFYLNYWAAVALLWPLAGNPPNPPGDVERAISDSGLLVQQHRSFSGGLYSAWLVRV